MLADLMKKSSYVVIFTGAGMSTESGLPDFRSAKTGLWENVRSNGSCKYRSIE